jgi:hypothetical protein
VSNEKALASSFPIGLRRPFSIGAGCGRTQIRILPRSLEPFLLISPACSVRSLHLHGEGAAGFPPRFLPRQQIPTYPNVPTGGNPVGWDQSHSIQDALTLLLNGSNDSAAPVGVVAVLFFGRAGRIRLADNPARRDINKNLLRATFLRCILARGDPFLGKEMRPVKPASIPAAAASLPPRGRSAWRGRCAHTLRPRNRRKTPAKSKRPSV